MQVQAWLLQNNLATEDELAQISKEIKSQVDEAVEFAKSSPWPAPEDLWADVVAKDDELKVIRGTEGVHNGRGEYVF